MSHLQICTKRKNSLKKAKSRT